MIARILVSVASCLLLSISEADGAARFVALGLLSGSSYAKDLSADGTIVVGTNSSKAFRWTAATGIQYLGNGPGGQDTIYAHAISGDGLTIVGEYGVLGGARKPFKWTQASGIVPIAPRLYPPTAVSYDGSIIVGDGSSDISWDGGVIVGTGGGGEGYRDIHTTRTWMGDLPGSDYQSSADAVSPDGAVIVGQSSTVVMEAGQQIESMVPIYWTESGGIARIGIWNLGQAKDISESKIVIVGTGSVLKGTGYDKKAFRWTPARGMESIQQVLLAQGINVAGMGWDLAEAEAVSANGRIIAGWGQHQGANESWLVELDIPGDFDIDGDSDGNDFLSWQRGFGSTRSAADLADWKASVQFLISLRPSATVVTTAVPEPMAVIIIAQTGLILFKTGSLRRNTRLVP